MNLKDRGTTLALSGVIVVSTVLGAAGGAMLSGLGAHAQTPSATPSAPATAPAPSGANGSGQAAPSGSSQGPGSMAPSGGNGRGQGSMSAAGPFKPNEDPAHEATESAEREAQEDAGQRPTVR